MSRWKTHAAERTERAALEPLGEHGLAETTVPPITARASLTTVPPITARASLTTVPHTTAPSGLTTLTFPHHTFDVLMAPTTPADVP